MSYFSMPKVGLLISDMDGVLIDTKDIVFKLYKDLGVDMPEDAWGKPWREWLPKAVGLSEIEAEFIHDQKTVAMLKAEIRWMAGADVLANAVTAHQIPWGIMTGASRQMLYHIGMQLTRAVGGIQPTVMVAEGRAIDKRQVLLRLRDSRPDVHVAYIDDDLEAGMAVVAGTRASFIHFNGQSPEELADQVWML